MIVPLFIGGIGMPEILLIVLVVLLLFGGKKIPELMKGLGKGVRSFKEGMNGLEKDDTSEEFLGPSGYTTGFLGKDCCRDCRVRGGGILFQGGAVFCYSCSQGR